MTPQQAQDVKKTSFGRRDNVQTTSLQRHVLAGSRGDEASIPPHINFPLSLLKMTFKQVFQDQTFFVIIVTCRFGEFLE